MQQTQGCLAFTLRCIVSMVVVLLVVKYGFPLLVDGYPRLFLGVLKFEDFEDIENGQAIAATPYQFDIQRAQTTASLILLQNPQSGEQIRVRIPYPSYAFEGDRCIRCVSIFTRAGKTYLIFRAAGGGSGGYYLNDVLEILDNQAIHQEGFLSCGRVYRRGQRLIFPSRERECPESILGYLPWSNWEYETFDLAE